MLHKLVRLFRPRPPPRPIEPRLDRHLHRIYLETAADVQPLTERARKRERAA
jgi:hypothetical protein